MFWYNSEWKLSCLLSFCLNMKSQLLFGFFWFYQLQLYHSGAAFSIVFIDIAALSPFISQERPNYPTGVGWLGLSRTEIMSGVAATRREGGTHRLSDS